MKLLARVYMTILSLFLFFIVAVFLGEKYSPISYWIQAVAGIIVGFLLVSYLSRKKKENEKIKKIIKDISCITCFVVSVLMIILAPIVTIMLFRLELSISTQFIIVLFDIATIYSAIIIISDLGGKK